MSDHNLPVPSMAGYSQESTSQNLSSSINGTLVLPNDGDIVYSTYGYNQPRIAQEEMGSAVPFVYEPTWMSTETATSTVGLTPQSQTLPTWFDNQVNEPVAMQNIDALGQQNSNRISTQDRSSNFLDQTVACIRAFNANSDPDDEQISKLAKEAGLTVTEMTCWFGLIPKIRQCAQIKPSASFAHVPLSPSESRSFASPDAGALIGQSDDSKSSRRPHSQIQMQSLPAPWRVDPRSSQVFSPPASRKRRLPSKSLTDTISMPVGTSSKRPRLNINEKLYPCLECEKLYPVDGWYEHLVRVHFPECVWTCGCKENKDTDMQKLWPRWDNFLKHLVERHAFKRSPAADASIKSRSIEVVGCYHHICGFCESPLQSRQNSIDHIKDHLDNGLQFENWTHLCLSNHDLRSHILTDLNCYPDINNRANHNPGDDENGGDGYGSYEPYRQQNYVLSNTPANSVGTRGSTGNSAGPSGSQTQRNRQSTTIDYGDCKVLETPLSSDLDEIMLPFKSVRELGHGGYGIVDEVVSSSSKETYARKTIRSRQASHNTTSYISQLRNELRILKKLDHPHLIKLVGYYTTHTSFYIIMSPVADVNLADYMLRHTSTTSLQKIFLLRWMSCLASAVEYLHDEKIHHRDIKPQNVLVKGQDVFLTDLGNAKLLLDPDDVSAGKMIITPMYCAPETMSEGLQDCKADIFSLGCVFTEMYIGYFGHSSQDFEITTVDFDNKPYHMRVRETQKYLKDVEAFHNHVLTPGLTLLFTTIRQMLEIEPTERPEAKSLLSSFPDDSRCCCSHIPTRTTNVTPSDNFSHLPVLESSGLEKVTPPTSKTDIKEDIQKYTTLNDVSPESTSQDLMEQIISSDKPNDIGRLGAVKLGLWESAEVRGLTEQAHTQAYTSQDRPENQHEPKSSDGEEFHLQDRLTYDPIIDTGKTSCNSKNPLPASTSFVSQTHLQTLTNAPSTHNTSQTLPTMDAQQGPTEEKERLDIERKLRGFIVFDASVSRRNNTECSSVARNIITSGSRDESYNSTLSVAIQQRAQQPSCRLQQHLSPDQKNTIEHPSTCPRSNSNLSNSSRRRSQSIFTPTILSPEDRDIIIQAASQLQIPSSDIHPAKRLHSPFRQFRDASYSFYQQPMQINQEYSLQHVSEGQIEHFFTCDDQWSSTSILQPKPVKTSQLLINTQDVMGPWNMQYTSRTSQRPKSLQPGLEFKASIIPRRYNGQYGDPQPVGGQRSNRSTPDYSSLLCEKQGPFRRRAFLSVEDRQQTAQTRKDKACIRCRMQKVRCTPDLSDPQGICLTCQKVTSLKSQSLPCVRYKITEIRLFLPSQSPGHERTQRWPDRKLKDISNWASDHTRIICTTEGFSAASLDLEVRQFVPIEGDVLDRHWFLPGGIKKSIQIPLYAIAYVEPAKRGYIEYVKRARKELPKSWLSNRDQLLVNTYTAAVEVLNSPDITVQEAELLRYLLQLWIAIRITTSTTFISGEETLGMCPEYDETSPFYGKIPVPPVMESQIELILTQDIQIPIRKIVLDMVQNLITRNRLNTWFTIYLCNFMLLHNCSMIIKSDASYAKENGLPGRYSRPHAVEDCYTGANVLLAHWHYCNKGSQPFSPEAGDFQTMAELNSKQTDLVKQTSQCVKFKANEWKLLRENSNYEDDFFFVSQLFEKDWKPRYCNI